MCCGSRRAAWRSAAAAQPVRSAVAPAPDAARPAPSAGPWAQGAFPTVPLRYEATGEVQLRGPVSGRAYRFSGSQPLQDVDARDAVVLLRSAAFRPAGAT